MTFNPKEHISYFAKTNFRKNGKVFGIKQRDRAFHTLILGKTGSGKSNLLKTLIYQDIINNRGLCIFDLHNDLIPDIRKYLPYRRLKDVVYLDIPNPNMPYLYNPLKRVSIEKRGLVASGILETFKKIFSASWGNRLEHILRYILLTLLDQKNSNFGDITKIIHNQQFRNDCIKNIVNKDAKAFFLEEYPHFSKSELSSVINKLGAFLSYPAIRRLLIENKQEISLRQIMDKKQILIINVNKGALGSDVSNIISSLLLTSIMNAGFSRVDMPEHKRKVFHLYLDEFQNYTNRSIISMLSEIRKYSITLTISTQYLSALDKNIKDSLLGNVGTQIVFRLGQDSKYYEKEFTPIFKTEDISSLANYDIYLKMMIDGNPSQPFSATTIKRTDYF